MLFIGNLDVQFISGVGQGANNTFYLNTNLDTPFLEFITYASSLASPPGTMSISYGSYEYEMDHPVMDHFSTEAERRILSPCRRQCPTANAET